MYIMFVSWWRVCEEPDKEEFDDISVLQFLLAIVAFCY
jgi:hypothetical protein